MEVELTIQEVLEFANRRLVKDGLEPVTRRTLNYWINKGILERPRRKGKAGRGLLPASERWNVTNIRELQIRFNFTLSDIDTALAQGSTIANISDFMYEVKENYGRELLPYARAYVCSHYIGVEFKDEVAKMYIALCVANGDEELNADQVASILEIDRLLVMDMTDSGELTHHRGFFHTRYLKSEIEEWKRRNLRPLRTATTNAFMHLVELSSELDQVDIDSLHAKSLEHWIHWIDMVHPSLTSLRSSLVEAQTRQRS